MNHGESVFSFIFASSFCTVVKKQLAWRNAWGKEGTGQNPAQPGTLHIINHTQHWGVALTCLSEFLTDLGLGFLTNSTPLLPEAPGPGETTHAHSSSSRRVKTAAVLQTELWCLTVHVSHQLLSICGFYLGPYVKTNSMCLTSAPSFHPDTSNSASDLPPIARRATKFSRCSNRVH